MTHLSHACMAGDHTGAAAAAQSRVDELEEAAAVAVVVAAADGQPKSSADTSNVSSAAVAARRSLELARALSLAHMLRKSPAKVSEERAAEFLARFGGSMAEGSERPNPLTLFLVLDQLRDGLDASPIPFHWHQLRWVRTLLRQASRVLELDLADHHRMAEEFLRLRGSGKPAQKMPTWVWLCRRATADPKAVVVAGSERLRVIVEAAVLQVTSRWLGRFPEPSLNLP